MLARRRLLVSGLVQGVGFRPFVHTLARSLGLTGLVGNDTHGAFIEVQGPPAALADFIDQLKRNVPAPAVIEAILIEEIEPRDETAFAIVGSEEGRDGGMVVPPDVATCDDCLRDLLEAGNRRHRYPFVTCSRCGPRFTLIRETPFDRAGTTMAGFRTCPACESEYRDPADRRFHAQTIACGACGPRVWFTTGPTGPQLFGDAALEQARAALAAGAIVAVKGIGGFHLACDATNDGAVHRLRQRKRRGDKPFALMAASLDMIQRHAAVDRDEEALLKSRERPIVLLRRRFDRDELSPAVAPGNNLLGFMLPYSPLHHLLLGDCPLVMTSGNASDEPIVTDNDAAFAELGAIADAFLVHDRPIHSPCDDSVVRVFAGSIYPVRRARGYAPLPIRVADGPPVLAVGGELKSVICIAAGERAHIGPHIGDTGNVETLTTLERSAELLSQMLRIKPQVVACDVHPGYLSGRWAAEFARRKKLPLVRVGHHHAHIAAILAEHGRAGPIIGVSFDGTGYGDDGAVWGGEFFVADAHRCRRMAHFDYVPLPGGDAAIERPYRMALAHLHTAGLDWNESLPCVRACPPAERTVLLAQLQKNINAPPTSSVGRLFDAVAALIGVRQTITYEAQAAIELEALACEEAAGEYEFGLLRGEPLRLDPRPVIHQVVRDHRAGVPPAVIATRFHRGLATAVASVCNAVRDNSALTTVGLTGGVFQNMLLLRLVSKLLEHNGFEVLVHRLVPANDGGLSLGQAVIARARMSAVAG